MSRRDMYRYIYIYIIDISRTESSHRSRIRQANNNKICRWFTRTKETGSLHRFLKEMYRDVGVFYGILFLKLALILEVASYTLIQLD